MDPGFQPSQRDRKRLPIAAPARPRLVSPEGVSHPVCKAPFEVNWKRASLSGRRTGVGEWGLAGRLQSGSDRCPARSDSAVLRILGTRSWAAACPPGLVALQEPGSTIRLFFNQERVNNVISPERSTAVSSLGGRRKTERLLSALGRGEFFCPAAFLLLL